MELLVEELEPIITATETARSLPQSPPGSSEEEEEPRIARRLDRVAQVCAARIRQMDRNLFLLGKAVSRLARHYDRERGLTALAARIRNAYGKVVTSQHLGQARLFFETYTRDEFENRFSHLTSTHLLKVAQAFPDASERDLRNDLLDDAVRENLAVSELIVRMKRCKDAKATADSPDSAPLNDEAPVEESRGYVCGEELTELGALSDRAVAYLRARETVPSVDAIFEAGRVLSASGLMIVELAGLDGYPDVSEAVNKTDSLRILHTLIVPTSSIHRRAPHDLPITDRYRVIVLVGGHGFHHSLSHPKHIGNPMSEADAEKLVYALVPNSGLVVDVGTGCIQTAEWACAHDREYLSVEPNEIVHAKKLTDLEASLDAGTSNKSTPPAAPDLWPMVSASQREGVTSGSSPWNAFTCCERTGIAVVVTGVAAMVCPVCRKKCTAKLGARSC